jgi:hypothetical protein
VTIIGKLPPLSPTEIIPVFIELSTARRQRNSSEVEPTEMDQREDALYAVVLDRLQKAAKADITPSAAP